MQHQAMIYIDGSWQKASTGAVRDVISPIDGSVIGQTAQASAADVDRAIAAARRAFPAFSATSVAERVEMIDRIIAAYRLREGELAALIAREVGIPVSSKAQVTGPRDHMIVARDVLAGYHFDKRIGNTIVRREAIGVCGLISPWNWPLQTPVIKAIYGIAAGCTVVLKPSDNSPLSGIALAEIFDAAGLPPGVFNLVTGAGRIVGEAMSASPEVDLISFTGSTGAGARVAEVGAATIKRSSLELGGKSANIVLEDADIEAAARWNIQRCFFNTGQSCHAPSRMLVPRHRQAEAVAYLVDEASRFVIGDPRLPQTNMGPVVSERQFATIQKLIQSALDEGARLACGGLGRPQGLEQGTYVQPTVFADVTPHMTIAREEIFGPVLAVIPYDSEAEALEIANDSIYGLGGYVFGTDVEKGRRFANGLAAGRVCFNGAATNSLTPMGGYKQSGIGRSMGAFGLEEYLQIKSLYGFGDAAASLPEMQF